MSKPLVVVESPTKVRTIKKYLGKDYNVAATVGHIRDLPAKEIGIDIENDFSPKYTVIPGKQKVIGQLKKAAGEAAEIYLAPDPDREGEAIAWHTAEVLKKKGRRFHRVLFHELTRNAILAAMAAPQTLNESKFEAQQARRILDRLVGYQVSPLLWRKVKGGLSAGRVQSVAVRIICERERAIQAFQQEEYWSITAHLEGGSPPPFKAKLVKKNDAKLKLPNEAAAQAALVELAHEALVVDKVAPKTTRRNPMPPFITSKLQQEAIRKLGFTAKKTMLVAQQLYEGVDLGPGEPVGLITYMRTDSTRISAEAAAEARELIRKRFGDAYAEEKPRLFTGRKRAQDAHEAIRPTSVENTPEQVAAYLSADQLSLYTLIWKRFVASQMKQALIDTSTVSIRAGAYQFTASGSTVRFAGFMALYMSVDDEIENEKDKTGLPPLAEGEVLKLHQYEPKQHFTLPPPRFSEASLVKELEENGIGRPSTYATIISTIRDKGYVDMVNRYFVPNELGFIVNDMVVASFPDIFDVEFTARLESELDRVEAGEAPSVDLLKRFYQRFKRELDIAADGMLNIKGAGYPTELNCPSCGKALRIKIGKNGFFLACSGYPQCTYSTDYSRDDRGHIQPATPAVEEFVDKQCASCGRQMVLKRGKYGEFLACSGYPHCTHTESLNGPGGPPTGVRCPEPECDGEIVEKKSRRGKTFYGCNRFPRCQFAIWDKPLPEPCPKCHAPFMLEKSTKKKGTYLMCRHPECGHKVFP